MKFEVVKNQDSKTNEKFPYEVIFRKGENKKSFKCNGYLMLGEVISEYKNFLFEVEE